MIVLTFDESFFAVSNEWLVAASNKQTMQRVTSECLQQATSATSSEWSLQRVTSNFLQRATSEMSNEWISQRVTSDFTTSNKQRVKSYASEQKY